VRGVAGAGAGLEGARSGQDFSNSDQKAAAGKQFQPAQGSTPHQSETKQGQQM